MKFSINYRCICDKLSIALVWNISRDQVSEELNQSVSVLKIYSVYISL